MLSWAPPVPSSQTNRWEVIRRRSREFSRPSGDPEHLGMTFYSTRAAWGAAGRCLLMGLRACAG